MLIGSHMSIAGGLSKALARGEDAGCATIQIFTKNASQWAVKPLDPDEVKRFRDACDATGIGPVVAHDSYLINLASPDYALYKKSIEAMKIELDRAEALGLPYVVGHPGAHVGSGEARGLKRIARAIDRIHTRTKKHRVQLLLETTAGQGSCLGARFEHLAKIIAMVKASERVGVCLDTCHIFTAGYDIRTKASYSKTMRAFNKVIGLDKLKVIHLNDSLKEFDSHRDRHAHIGQGLIGLDGFRCVMTDRRLKKIPKILETPKGEDLAEDRMNLGVLRKLAAKKK